MSEVVVPYTNFNPDVLANGMMDAVRDAKPHLAKRHLLGVISRFGGDYETAVGWALFGQQIHDHGQFGAFAIVDDSGQIAGGGSIDPNLRVRRLGVPLPPAVVPNVWSTRYHDLCPNIHAWSRDPELLDPAYEELVALSRQPQYYRLIKAGDVAKATLTWTVEPMSSTKEVHQSIQKAGLKAEVDPGRFDDEESGRHRPPLGLLYKLGA
jgi:hypothetical protein